MRTNDTCASGNPPQAYMNMFPPIREEKLSVQSLLQSAKRLSHFHGQDEWGLDG